MLAGFKRWIRDTGERAARTFVQAFLGTLFAGGVIDIAQLRNVSAVHAAVAAGIAAVISLIMSVGGKGVGNTDNASLDPHQP